MNNPYNLPPDRARAVQEGESFMKDILPVAAPVRQVVRPASPPLRRGALQAPNGQYAGYTYFNPINNSASPVIGAYSPYPTMLFAPRMFDGVGYATQLYLNSLRNRPSMAPSFMASLQRPRVSSGAGVNRTKPSTGAPATQPPSAQAPAYNPDDFYKDMVLNQPSFPQSADRAGAGGGGGGGGGVGAGPVNDSTTYWGGLNTGSGARGWVGQGGGLGGMNDIPKGGPGGDASPEAAPRSKQSSQRPAQTIQDENRARLQRSWDMLPLAVKFQIYLQTGQWGPQF